MKSYKKKKVILSNFMFNKQFINVILIQIILNIDIRFQILFVLLYLKIKLFIIWMKCRYAEKIK